MSESKSGSFEVALAAKKNEILDRVLPMEAYDNGLTLSRGTFSVKLGEIARWALEYLAKGGEAVGYYHGRGNHSVNNLEAMVEKRDEALAASNARNVILEQRANGAVRFLMEYPFPTQTAEQVTLREKALALVAELKRKVQDNEELTSNHGL